MPRFGAGTWVVVSAIVGAAAGGARAGGEGDRPGPRAESDAPPYLQISGIYPHLAAFSTPGGGTPDAQKQGEAGIGAVVPWAGRLWFLTYPQHQTRGSRDKLYEVDGAMNLTVRPESVGGTHASRLIHRESNQLFIGPYAIDADRNVRAIDVNRLVGRMTATMRHLTDPANRVYYYDMEGALYEVDVHSLAVTKLFDKPVPGWHGKGAYTAQGRLVLANNGEAAAGGRGYRDVLVGGPPESDEDVGVLAEYDGREWRIVARRPFTDVTGPGGILGSPDDTSPLWSIGWDRRSVLLKLLDGGTWSTFRLPKASHTYDPSHGYFTEWPRIREVQPGRFLMVMHGTLFAFPPTFARADTAGLRPLATHLRYIPDIGGWGDRVVLAADDTSMMQNPLAGQPQSNLWFGAYDELEHFGPRAGWGGVWVGDDVEPGAASDPFLIAGYDRRVLHVAHNAPEAVGLTMEVDRDGKGSWSAWKSWSAPPGYSHLVLPADLETEWVRLKADRACHITAYFHLSSDRPAAPGEDGIFAGLADVTATGGYVAGPIRPAGHNRSLQFLAQTVSDAGRAGAPASLEVTLDADARDLAFAEAPERAEELARIAAIRPSFAVDAASVIVTAADGARYRLPKGDPAFDSDGPTGPLRGIREAVSERFLANLHGTFYEIPRDGRNAPDIARIKPVAGHRKRIADFCTWRGLLVLSGVRADAPEDGHVFRGADGAALWFGAIDDLWKLGKPTGRGGPWRDTPVEPGVASDPYLMTGYDRKAATLSHDADGPVTFALEVDFDHRYWRPYATIRVPAGESVTHTFPEGYQAHWVRVTADRPCRATATFAYD